jgi:hypothetical protein
MTYLPVWTQWLLAFATPTLAVVGVFIAVLQWRLSRHKLKMDLFDKRYQVYLSTKQFLAHVGSNAKVDFKEIISFGRNTMQGIFLFDKDVTDYLKQIEEKAVDLLTVQTALNRPSEADKDMLWKNQEVALKWFSEQLTEVNKYFRKTLDVKPP